MASSKAGLPAIAGGTPVRNQPLPTIGDAQGRDLGADELAQLSEVIGSGKLNRNDGVKVKSLEAAWEKKHKLAYATASTSGTAAIHVALGSLSLNPGDEIITTPITDFGSFAPILAQNCVPVFADLDPRTYCLDPSKVEESISPRTRAILAVHLMGHPCNLDALVGIAREYGLYLIEDSSQAHFATWRGQLVGTFGDLATFSLQQSKQITCGDGGMTMTNDPKLGELIAFFADKGDDRRAGRRDPRIFGLNYRMTELQGAVALAQLGKAKRLVGHRRLVASQITVEIAGHPVLNLPTLLQRAYRLTGNTCSQLSHQYLVSGLGFSVVPYKPKALTP